MKPSTEIHWKFENRGTKADTLDGSGNFVQMGVSLMNWMAGVTMNNKIVIEIGRTPSVTIPADDDAMMEMMLAAAGLTKEDI